MRFAYTSVQLASKKHTGLRLQRYSSTAPNNPSSSQMGKKHQNLYKELV